MNIGNVPEQYQPEEVVDKIYHVRDLDVPKEILTQPVKDLGIKEQIVKLQKSGSFVKHLFIGRYDTDFLTYPEILKTRKEFDKVLTQCEMIERTFKDTLINPKILKDFGFDLLYRWTVTEMMTVFESMGSAMVIKPMDYNYKQVMVFIHLFHVLFFILIEFVILPHSSSTKKVRKH